MTTPNPSHPIDLSQLNKLWPSGAALSDLEALGQGYRGCLMGVAVGDALGLPVEGSTGQSIRELYPDGLRFIAGRDKGFPWDDDLAQSMLIADALLAAPSLTLDDLAERLLHWRDTNGHGIGLLTAAVLSALRKGFPTDQAAYHIWDMLDGDAASNGAVMRCSPVALRWWHVPEKLAGETLTSAVITHYDSRCGWAAVAVNVAVAFALNDWPLDLSALAASMAAAGAPASLVDAIPQAATASPDSLGLDGEDMGYALKAMQVGLWASGSNDGFEEALVRLISCGGDTDTNGAIAGAVLGAKYGFDAIPSQWIDRITGVGLVLDRADRLLAAVVG